MLRTLNLGILAHVDAGKTTLTERLLYAAGVIDEIGSVDDGTTQTDFLALERQRGITIRSAVVSFVVDDVTINLIDTPGHPDFIAEVERVLSVLDGAVLVISAVEGVQAQTRVLMRTLQRLRIPTLIFVNKIDRGGARDDGIVLDEISGKLTPAIVAMNVAHGLGSRDVYVTASTSAARLAEALALNDEALLAAYVDDDTRVPYHDLRGRLIGQTKRSLVHPVFFGSAITGVGVDGLIAGLTEFLPATKGDIDGVPSGTVFKVERGPAGEKVAYVRMFGGTLRTRDKLDGDQKVTAINVFDRGATEQRTCVVAGQIGKLWGLNGVRIGDSIGARRMSSDHLFAPPTLETVVVPRNSRDKGPLHAALAQLAEQDPLINLRQDDIKQELFVSLYGEVQKEVIQETLASEYDIEADFRESTTICVERPIGIGAAAELKRSRSNPFPLGAVGLRVEPLSPGSGVSYGLERHVLGKMPLAFFKAVEDTVTETLEQGLYGWQVTDCKVTMTHAGYSPRQSAMHQGFNKAISSTGGDFRKLTPLVLVDALRQAGTVVCEPIHRFHLEFPAESVGVVLPALARIGAVPEVPVAQGSLGTIEGEIPAAAMHELQLQLRSLTRGEGVLECSFSHHEPVRGPRPTRPRWDHNPLDRKEYLLHVTRNV